MHAYRTHTCAELSASDVGETVRLSGWVHRKRDHGHLLFVDLRDHYGITQLVIHPDQAFFDQATHLKPESVVTITGQVVKRSPETVNAKMPSGEIEVVAADLKVQSTSETLPFQVAE